MHQSLQVRGCSHAWGKRRQLTVKASCPLPMRPNSDARLVCMEICPAAAQQTTLEADPKLGSAVLVGGRIFSIKL